MCFVICPKPGPKMEGVILLKQDWYFRDFFCPKKGQGFRPPVTPQNPNFGQVSSLGMCYIVTCATVQFSENQSTKIDFCCIPPSYSSQNTYLL